MNIRYKLCLLLYYGFARHLPKSTVPVIGTAAKKNAWSNMPPYIGVLRQWQ